MLKVFAFILLVLSFLTFLCQTSDIDDYDAKLKAFQNNLHGFVQKNNQNDEFFQRMADYHQRLDTHYNQLKDFDKYKKTEQQQKVKWKKGNAYPMTNNFFTTLNLNL